MTRGRRRAAWLVGWLLLGAAGCETRTGDEMQWGPISTPPWTIGGVRAGMSIAAVEQVRGGPAPASHRYGTGMVHTWRNPDLSVTFDADGRAIDVLGDRLTTPSGEVVLQRGASEAEVVGRLGPGKHKGSYRPGGSGVISCSMQRIGGEHAYEDATTRYTVSIYEDRLASVRAQPLPVSKR